MPSIKLVVVLQARESCSQKLREVLQKLRDESLGEQGCLEYRVEETQSKAGCFFLLESWADAVALEFHEQTEHYIQGVARVSACCDFVDIHRVE